MPGRVRPARPARCCALAFDIGVTRSDSTRIRGLYTFCLEKPGSITRTTPSIVNDVSAILVYLVVLVQKYVVVDWVVMSNKVEWI